MSTSITRTLVAVAIIVGACGGTNRSGAAATSQPAETPVLIAIEDFAFKPDTVTVPVGTTVTWENREDGVTHTSTADDGRWKSGGLAPGERFSFTFDQPGTYTYICSIHPRMKATIVVEG